MKDDGEKNENEMNDIIRIETCSHCSVGPARSTGFNIWKAAGHGAGSCHYSPSKQSPSEDKRPCQVM